MSDQQKEVGSNLWKWLIGAGLLYAAASLIWTGGFNGVDQLLERLFTAQYMILFGLLAIVAMLERIRESIVRQMIGISIDMEELIRISVHAESIAERLDALRYGQNELRREVSSIATHLETK
jgi:hypothetical protein